MNTDQNTEQLVKTICDASQYGISLKVARRFTEAEKPKYAEWFRELGFVGMSHEQEPTLEHLRWTDMPKRPDDGSFCGCNNKAWIISEEEWNEYISLNERRAKEYAEKKRNENISALTAKKEYMETLKELPTRTEAAQLAKQYNDINNDGGEGYVPHFYSKEEYAETCESLSKFISETRTN